MGTALREFETWLFSPCTTPHDPHHRFDRYGAVSPKTRGDFAFLLHMLGVTNAEGMAGVVMPHGILFRGGAEGKIRRGIVEADLFEAVIGLAPKSYRAYPISASSWSMRATASSRRRSASRSWVRAASTDITSTGSVVSA